MLGTKDTAVDRFSPSKKTSMKMLNRKVTDQDIDSDLSEDDEYIEDEISFKHKLQNHPKNSRVSVSAEAYGAFNKKEAFVARVIKKTPEQKQRIKDRLSQAFMFALLEPKDREVVIDAMEEIKFKAGEWVIKQGNDGNDMYVVEKGELDCFKQFSKNEQPKYLKTYKPGESFGELALLYNAPRAASIQSKTDSILFALDRATFNNIVKEAAIKRRERFESTLVKIELLDSIDPYERSKIADSVNVIKVPKGTYVIKQGDAGETFYFIEEGNAIATKATSGGAAEVVYNYKPGDYFGELALLRNAPRAANVIATTDMTLLSLDRYSFVRLLGPLEDILQRNSKKYEKYMAN